MLVTEKLKIFEYMDYREYLVDYFNSAKLKNSRYSLRSFSDKLGFKSKDFINRVMKGEKNLTPSSITQICKGLGLSNRETIFFESIVYFCQAQTADEREKYFVRVRDQIKTVQFSEKQMQIGYHQYEVYSHWHHSAVRSYIGMHGFDGNYKLLASKIYPQITVHEARNSVALLIKIGLIVQDSEANWVLSKSAISTGDRVSKLAFKSFHHECLKLASDAIDMVPSNSRNISGLTLGISEKKYQVIVDRLNSFRKEIAMLVDDDPEADRVYQLNLQFFPLSQIDK